ncbi:MAG: pseudouridine synthase [Candidatus Woesearchaeota archaeon]|jgi:pseudouridine synthase
MLIRVQKILADAGVASRRKCEELIKQGRVKINGKLAKLGDKADLEINKITLNGQLIKSVPNKVYLMINKPWSIVTTVSEDHHMKTIMDLLPIKERIFPVGRLDRYSDGLLLFTNDGELAHKLTHPSFGVSKIYIAKLNRPISREDLEKVLESVIDDREVKVEKLNILAPNRVEIKIHEGRKHIVRRIFEELGYLVTKLTRIQFGPLQLGELKVGQWRYLNEKEIEQLRKALKPKTNQKEQHGPRNNR